jgi:type IV secretory pathway TrbF-like protein
VNRELLAAIATVAFKSLSASEVLSNPFRLYVYAFDWASNRVAGRAL